MFPAVNTHSISQEISFQAYTLAKTLKGRPAHLRCVAVLMASRCVHGLAWLPRNDCHLLPQLVHLLLDDRCRASEASHMGTTN